MEKKELFRIMAAADGSMLREMAQPLAEKYGVSVVKAPAKTLAMIKLREPVKTVCFIWVRRWCAIQLWNWAALKGQLLCWVMILTKSAPWR